MTKEEVLSKSYQELVKLREIAVVSDSPNRFTIIRWIDEEMAIRTFKDVLVETSEFEGVD